MEQVLVESYSQAVNSWVIRTPGRKFPALVIQGDSYSQLFDLAQSIVERTRLNPSADPELLGEAEELRDMIWGKLHNYELTLQENGFTLPYVRNAWPK